MGNVSFLFTVNKGKSYFYDKTKSIIPLLKRLYLDLHKSSVFYHCLAPVSDLHYGLLTGTNMAFTVANRRFNVPDIHVVIFTHESAQQ